MTGFRSIVAVRAARPIVIFRSGGTAMKRARLARFATLSLYVGGLLSASTAAQNDPRVGTWELNLGKSTFSPGPPPQRQTLWYKVEGQQMIALLQGVDGEGRPITPDP